MSLSRESTGFRTPRTISLLILPVLMLCFVAAAWAQNCESCQRSVSADITGALLGGSRPATILDDSGAWTIRQRVDEVMVFFTVTAGHKYIDDLTQEDIAVLDDHKPPTKIAAFGHQSDLPLRLGLLVDTSNSVYFRFHFEQEAARRFLRRIVRPREDLAFVIGFSDETNLLQDYTDDVEKLAQGITLLRPDGGTAMYDAVRNACDKLTTGREEKPTAHILVVLSDGEDNESKISFAHLIDIAQRQQVTIYTISTNNSDNFRPGDKILEELARQTAGKVFFPHSAKAIDKAFAAVEKEMRSRYVISYRPSELLEDGRYRHIEIKAARSRKRFHVYARKGYYAPLIAQTPSKPTPADAPH